MSFNVPKGLRKVFFLPFIIIIINMIVMLGFVRLGVNNIHKHSIFWRLANDHNADVLMRCRTVLVSMRNVDRFGYGMITNKTNYLEHKKKSVRSMGNRFRIVGGVETEQLLSR